MNVVVVVEVCKSYMGFKEEPNRVRVITDDAFHFLEEKTKDNNNNKDKDKDRDMNNNQREGEDGRYDIIFIDAYDEIGIPSQLLTTEFLKVYPYISLL